MLKENNNCKHCGRCCENMSLTSLQAIRINRYLRANPEIAIEVRDRLHEIPRGTCIFLNEENECAIYPARPEICKVFGVKGVDEGLICPEGTESTNVTVDEAQRLLETYTVYQRHELINMRNYYEWILGILVR